jgi:general secretion pathway protein E
VIARVDELLATAVDQGASDLYVEPVPGGYRLRLRVDGLFRDVGQVPAPLGERLLARIKVMARLAVHRTTVPQEGRLRLPGGVEVRASLIPTINGERGVLRLLSPAGERSLDGLGLEPTVLATWRRMLALPQGVLIVCGPSGSGKTTTLYASLEEILARDGARRSICTLEDPVERNLGAIAQTEVDPTWGFDFAAGLRAVLRQDPEVLMIGEIRDAETARIGLQAGLTGHLVLSSLHTASAIEALARLADLGATPGVLASAVKALMAQRLVRRAGPDSTGRRAIAELLVMDDRLRRLIRRSASPTLLTRAARRAGWRPVREVLEPLLAAGAVDPSDAAFLLQEE